MTLLQETTGPRYFRESRDGITYHPCPFPGHAHLIPERYEVCYDIGSWTWESRYAR